jgi:tRNA nucleotidyltransferase (CCA-adding enzyme)
VTALRPPTVVLDIATVLENAGFETWCVGGAVRDALLGQVHLDWDLATSATPQQVKLLFRRTVPVGIEHGTIGVLDPHGTLHEVTTFRRDVKTDGRHAVVEFGASLDEDLARRDLTINAIAWSPSRHVLHDPFDGRVDLARKVVRAVGDPPSRMREDRLRALRAIRFASRFGFTIEPATWAAIVESAPFLKRLSAERVRQELEKTMEQVARPSEAIALWKRARVLDELLVALVPVSDVAIRSLDCLPMPGLAGRPQRRTNRIAALFLELGGRGADSALRALRCSNSDVAWISTLADRWAMLGTTMEEALLTPDGPPDGEIRRWAAIVGRTRLGPLLRLAAARWQAAAALGQPSPSPERVRALYRRALRIAWRDPIELADLAVDGDDLLQARIAAGPALGRVLAGLLDAVVTDPALNTREALLSLARRTAGQN